MAHIQSCVYVSICVFTVPEYLSVFPKSIVLSIKSRKGNVNGTQPYAKLPSEALFANSLGVLIVVFGLVVLYILSNQGWQRPEPNHDGEGYRVRLTDIKSFSAIWC